jgi:hypothetical protein
LGYGVLVVFGGRARVSPGVLEPITGILGRHQFLSRSRDSPLPEWRDSSMLRTRHIGVTT